MTWVTFIGGWSLGAARSKTSTWQNMSASRAPPICLVLWRMVATATLVSLMAAGVMA